MKKKFLALAMASAVMVMGAGYAYWNDTSIINNSISTGNLDVKFVDQNTTRGGDDQAGKIATDENKSKAYWAAYVKHEGLNGGPATTVTNGGKTVNTLVTNMYPGAYAQYYGTLENEGSIPAVIKNVTVDFKGKYGSSVLTAKELELKGNLHFAFGYVIKDAAGNKITPNTNSGDGRYYQSGDMTQFQDKLNTLLKGVRLEPTQKLSLDFPSVEDAQAAMTAIGYPYNSDMHCITYTFDGESADNDTQEQGLGISITIDWTQHNAPL